MGHSHPPNGIGKFEIESCREGGDYILRARGELDLASCPLLKEQIKLAERTDAARIVIDVNGLDFIDSSGLGVFVAAKRRADRNGRRLRFTRGSGQIAHLFQLTGLDQALPFLEELDRDRRSTSVLRSAA